jgi:hypothetical protein
MNPHWLVLSFFLLEVVLATSNARALSGPAKLFTSNPVNRWNLNNRKESYLKAITETLVKFFAASSLMAAELIPPTEVCPGMKLNFWPGQEAVIRLGNRLGCKVMWTQFDGTVELFITYPSGKTERRVISPGSGEFRYAESPSSLRVKAVTQASLRFMAQKPDQVQPPQAQSQAQSKASLPSTINNFVMMMFSVIVGCCVMCAIIWLTKKSSAIVDSHWATLIENLQASPMEFYASVEKAIEQRQVPAISNCRVDWKEGGLFTTFREYLRISRERHVFDICGAPYGTGFFVSWWLAELQPSAIGPTLAALWIVLSIDTVSNFFFGFPQRFVVTCIAVILIFLFVGILINRSSGANWVRYVLVIPVIGRLMNRFFLPATYYRIDTASMFRSAIHNSVQEVIDQIIKAKGLRALTELERKPVLREFFQK